VGAQVDRFRAIEISADAIAAIAAMDNFYGTDMVLIPW
jgi:hypothetical protein